MKVILLLLFLSICVYADEEGKAGQQANYYFNSQTGTMIVNGFRGIYSFRETTDRPWQSITPLIKHLKISGSVTSVGIVAFMLCENLQTLEIGEMVQYLDTQSFYGCTSLKSIVLPSNVLVIYPFALSMCTSLSSIVISGNLISGSSAFSKSRLNNYRNSLLLNFQSKQLLKCLQEFRKAEQILEIYPTSCSS